MIRLVDMLKAAGVGVDTGSLKIHLACWNGREDPIDIYFAGRFKEWQERQRHRNFRGHQVIGLIDRGQGNWLFVGVYRVLGCRPRPGGGFIYSTTLLPGQEDLIGRITVYHKRTRASYVWYNAKTPLPILEVSPARLTIEEFPGYNAVVLSHDKLKIVTTQQIASWYSALANVRGVYLITDTRTGRHYVGKASGGSGIWQRWCSYAQNGHGGNEGLKRLLRKMGSRYMANLQYSILEIADTHASEKDILARESYWMNALRTREHGLN